MFSFFKSDKGEPQPEEKPAGWAARLRQGLTRTREKLGRQLTGLFGSGAKIDEDLYEELETILLSADVGIEATQYLLDDLRRRVKAAGLTDAAQLQAALQESLLELLTPLEKPLTREPTAPS